MHAAGGNRPDSRRGRVPGDDREGLNAASRSPSSRSSAATARRPETASPAVDSTGAYGERSDDLLDRVHRADEPGCSAAVGIEGDVVWGGRRAGWPTVATGRPIETARPSPSPRSPSSSPRPPSCCSCTTATCPWTTPSRRGCRACPSWSGAVTVGQAMHLVSGIPDYVDLGWSRASTDRAARGDGQLPEIAAIHGPGLPARGPVPQYSNSNYVLLGEVVRAVAGRPVPGRRPRRASSSRSGSPWSSTRPAGTRAHTGSVVRRAATCATRRPASGSRPASAGR